MYMRRETKPTLVCPERIAGGADINRPIQVVYKNGETCSMSQARRSYVTYECGPVSGCDECLCWVR